MPQIWTDDRCSQLLLCIIAQSNGTAINWQAVADAMGGEFTSSAVSQKFKKIKRKNQALMDQANASPSTPSSATGSARKRKNVYDSARAKAAIIEDDKEQLGESASFAIDDTPSKRTKHAGVKREDAIKIDDIDADDDVVQVKPEAAAAESKASVNFENLDFDV